jgi:hypothetical protein
MDDWPRSDRLRPYPLPSSDRLRFHRLDDPLDRADAAHIKVHGVPAKGHGVPRGQRGDGRAALSSA